MSILSYLLPVRLATLSSPYNRNIRVVEEYGKRRLVINGAEQSGPYVSWILKTAFKAFGIPGKKPINRVLMFGMGGGSAVHILRSQRPDALFTIVDIDSVIIDTALKYFGIREYGGITTQVSDAAAYAHTAASGRDRFDLIIIDIYIGRDIPDEVSTDTFLKDVSRLLTRTGDVFVNYVWDLGYEEKWQYLNTRLASVFPFVETKKVEHNMFFHARKT